MTTNDDNIKWVVERLQALQQEREDARRENREVDHAACRIASESYLQDLLRAYDRLDEARAEIERLQAELLTAHRTWAERCSAWSDSVEEAEAERDEARAEVERLREMRQRGCDCNDEDACRFARERDEARAEVERLKAERDAAHRAGQEAMRERCAALCAARYEEHEQRLWAGPPAKRITDRVGGMTDEAEQCAVAIRAMEVEP
jgi:chromosome segregation ATPase